MKRAGFILVGLLLLLLATGVRWPQPTFAASEPPFEGYFIAPLGDKPENNWYVCRDLGVGPVPGLGIRRQRFRLCHNQGWEVLAYCVQPDLPAPVVGTRCSRTGATTYWCGSGIQNLREYAVVETPVPIATPTPQPTATPLPTSTPTLTPTPQAPSAPPTEKTQPPKRPKSTPRAPSGGRGNFDLQGLLDLVGLTGPTRTPFQPHLKTPTPFFPHAPTRQADHPTSPTAPEAQTGFYNLDLADPGHRVRILIFPSDKSVNGGKPILISFIPGQTCNYGDNRGCVNTYLSQAGVPVTFITVHSGMGGEGQAYRQAMEGSGINSAGLSLKEVRAHLRALQGAEVVILQGKRRYGGYILAAAARIPSRYLKTYFESDIQDALAFASSLDENLAALANGGMPLLVFETCGWKMASEPWARGVTSTTASVYLGVIQKKP